MMQNVKIQSANVDRDFYLETQIGKNHREERENSQSFEGYSETQ